MEDTPLVSFVTEVKKWKDIEPSRSLNDKMRVGDSKVDNSQDHLNTRTHSHSGWHCGLVSGKKKQKKRLHYDPGQRPDTVCVFEVSASCCLPAENQLDWKKAAGRKRKEKDAQKRKPISVTIKPWNHQTAATYQEINQWCVAKWKKQHFNHVKLEKLTKEK